MNENENTTRVERFKGEIADMKLRDPATSRDRLLLKLGVLGMLGGIVLGIYAVVYVTSAEGVEAPLEQREAVVLAVVGLTLAAVGAALFLKASLAGFLRFWMARLCYEQQEQAARIAAAVAPASTGDNSNHASTTPSESLPG